MKTKALKYISFGSIALLIAVMVSASLCEKFYGRDFAMNNFYSSLWFSLLWGVCAISAVMYLLRKRNGITLSTMTLHLSLLVILLGACVTHFFGMQGSLHLRKDADSVNVFTLNSGTEQRFPFSVKLNDFSLDYYPGTFAPMDFISNISIVDGKTVAIGKVSMNNIFTYRGYRFYQSGYDKDAKGTLLSVAFDPWGIAITYFGYAMLLLSMVAFFLERGSRFKTLLSQISQRKSMLLVMTMLMTFGMVNAQKLPSTLPVGTAEQFGRLYVYYNDRVCPMQTLAIDFLTKVYGHDSYRGLSAEQVLTGWIFYYDEWKSEKMIKINDAEIRRVLSVDGKYAALEDFVDLNGFKLDMANIQNLGLSQKSVAEANEKVNIISMAATGNLLKMFPYRSASENIPRWFSLADRLPADMPNDQWSFVRGSMNYVAEKVAMNKFDEVEDILKKIGKYQQREAAGFLPSNAGVKAERVYNETNYNLPSGIVCVCCGIALFVVACIGRIKKTRVDKYGIWRSVPLVLVWCYLTIRISLCGFISGYFPVSNGYETMVFLAWCGAVVAIVWQRKSDAVLPFGYMLCGLAMLVAAMSAANPQITQLMPVLQSPLLSVHVVLIMLAYSLLFLVLVNGVMALVLNRYGVDDEELEYLRKQSLVILYPAVFLLTIGIFIGAVWANVSWGRYWGWDPKEVWALITMLVYAFALHSESLPWFRKPLHFHIYSVIAFLTVLITYFGVNFLMGGMHSYA